MIDAARLGVWLLFALVAAVHLALSVFFLKIRKRARNHAGSDRRPLASSRPKESTALNLTKKLFYMPEVASSTHGAASIPRR